MEYHGVAPDKVEGLVQGFGADCWLESDGSYRIIQAGFDAKATYDTENEVLVVDLVHKPFLVPESFIWNQLGAYLGAKPKDNAQG